MAKILNTDFNNHGYKFITIEVEPRETCKYEPVLWFAKYRTSVYFYPVDLDGRTHEIQVCRRDILKTGEISGYGKTWLLGCGNGSAMGWTYGLTYREALNAAIAYSNVIENSSKVAHVYFENVENNWTRYSADKVISL